MMQLQKLTIIVIVGGLFPGFISCFCPQRNHAIQDFRNYRKHTFTENRIIYHDVRLAAEFDDEENNQLENNENQQGNLEGFLGYLGPYALAFLASIAVTAGFVKFVLMDY